MTPNLDFYTCDLCGPSVWLLAFTFFFCLGRYDIVPLIGRVTPKLDLYLCDLFGPSVWLLASTFFRFCRYGDCIPLDIIPRWAVWTLNLTFTHVTSAALVFGYSRPPFFFFFFFFLFRKVSRLHPVRHYSPYRPCDR